MIKADKMLSAFRSDGFAEVELPMNIARRLLQLADMFYAKPISERLTTAVFYTSGVLGYSPSEKEALEISIKHGVNVPIFSDMRSRGYCSYDYIANEHILSTTELFGNNFWPADEEFKEEACELYRIVSQFVKGIAQSILDHLNNVEEFNILPQHVFNKECCSIMRLLKYEKYENEMVSKPHNDYEFISLVYANAQGLEVMNSSGLWSIVTCDVNKVVILPGDMLEVATNGGVPAVLHRVRFGGSKERLAVIYFQGLALCQEISYFLDGKKVVSTFGNHLCGMLIRGAPHLQHKIKYYEQKFGVKFPEKNPFLCNT